MKASVIIPTRNRAKLLDGCLQSLTRQTLPPDAFEVLVVDNGSSDDTATVAARYQNTLQLRYLHASEPGLHVGRHAGLRNARSEILIFGDDDIVAEREWVESVVQAFSTRDVALVGGNNLPLFEHSPPEWLQRWWQRRVYVGQALGQLSILDFGQGIFEIDPGYVWGCNFSIRKQVLLDAGGFHPDGVPADRLRWRGDGETHVSDMIRRSGRKALFHSGASVGHRVSSDRMTASYFTQRSYAQGISDSFTDLRRSRRAQSFVLDRCRRRLLATRARMRAARRNLGDDDPAARALREVEIAALEGHRSGYDFHQREVSSDPTLLAWVLKENYF